MHVLNLHIGWGREGRGRKERIFFVPRLRYVQLRDVVTLCQAGKKGQKSPVNFVGTRNSILFDMHNSYFKGQTDP